MNGEVHEIQLDLVGKDKLPFSAAELAKQAAEAKDDVGREVLVEKMLQRQNMETDNPEVVGAELIEGLRRGLETKNEGLLRQVVDRMQRIVNRGYKGDVDFMRVPDDEIKRLLGGEVGTIYVATGSHGDRIFIAPRERRIHMSGDTENGCERRQNFVRLFKGVDAVKNVKAGDFVEINF